ncbi:cystathionine beta-lyase [Bordetella genomosp. 5]|uniref:Cystathionine beta-lyase n=1 Tax=Bordetella genomosp. 5 TaxID=1395608 RepID=A0A261TQL1_9BORD|nr:cystathionine beta-lyase [Bordetella genomosp. 5]OZI51926.1 cystathionine beta-lyase [Bordetella genomosp. 5]
MHWRTRLVQPQSLAPKGFASLTVPTHRASTVLFERQADVRDGWRQDQHGYTYGVYGTPTTLELGARIAQLEGAHHTFVVPGGQAAIALVYLSVCKPGCHVLVPYSAYGPNLKLARGLLARFDVTIEAYDPLIGAGIDALIRPETALIWTESPGSVTMEIQDVPAICAAARARGVTVALDNTYAAGVLFDAFAHGVDISIQALTKYVGGHSDLLLGTVSVRDADLKTRVGDTHQQLGMAASPDDCSLALRGLQTLALRLDHLERATLEIARWLAEQPQIEAVYHPALPDCPGHAVWKRDFTGSASVFSILFRDAYDKAAVAAFIDALQLFKIGMSWGGVTSLALSYPELARPNRDYAGRLVRLNIGLEQTQELIDDLRQALAGLDGG